MSMTYPWEHHGYPSSIEQVHGIIIRAIKRVCDLTDDEIEELIDNDIYEVGCG